eukprot:14080967-Heterocapsa_arctica.AAC.1
MAGLRRTGSLDHAGDEHAAAAAGMSAMTVLVGLARGFASPLCTVGPTSQSPQSRLRVPAR